MNHHIIYFKIKNKKKTTNYQKLKNQYEATKNKTKKKRAAYIHISSIINSVVMYIFKKKYYYHNI